MDVREFQRDAVLRMMNFNAGDEEDEDGGLASEGAWSDQWKVIVYDSFCRDVIQPLLSVTQMRKQGVTLHMLLSSDREQIPDVPAVYFVLPTEDAVARISRDCAARLYDAFHLNFASPLPRPRLEQLASGAVESDSLALIAKVYDQFLQFVSLEDRLFVLQQPRSYLSYRDPRLEGEAIMAAMDDITNGLFCVLATMKVVPIIRAPRGGPAEMVAKKLDAMLREHLLGGSRLFDAGAARSFSRPLLIILERNIDLAVCLRHTTSYQALLHDLLQLRNNRLTLERGGKTTQLQLDSREDAFWAESAGRLFPDAISMHSEQLKQVQDKEAEIRAHTRDAPEGSEESKSEADVSPSSLMTALDSLPVVLEQRKVLERHGDILEAAFSAVAEREVATFLELEGSITSTAHADVAEVEALLADAEKGNVADKLRLLCVYYLCCKPSKEDMTRLEAALRSGTATAEEDVDLSALAYLKRTSSLSLAGATASLAKEASSSGSSGGGGGGSAARPTAVLFVRTHHELSPLRMSMLQQWASLLSGLLSVARGYQLRRETVRSLEESDMELLRQWEAALKESLTADVSEDSVQCWAPAVCLQASAVLAAERVRVVYTADGTQTLLGQAGMSPEEAAVKSPSRPVGELSEEELEAEETRVPLLDPEALPAGGDGTRGATPSFGFLAVLRPGGGRLHDDDMLLLTGWARLLSVDLANMRTFQQLARQQARLDAMLAATEQLFEDVPLPPLLSHLARQLAALCGCDRVQMLLPVPAAEEGGRRVDDLPPPLAPGMPRTLPVADGSCALQVVVDTLAHYGGAAPACVHLGAGFAGFVAVSGQPLLLSPVDEGDARLESAVLAGRHFKPAHVLALPLQTTTGELLGVLQMGASSMPLTSQEEETAVFFALAMKHVIEHGRLKQTTSLLRKVDDGAEGGVEEGDG
eukprot:PLAT15505.2.p1 GENE.PLAT15505.2~~PLAT15505.2.p1  ORF type:complete len:929 (-),score=487.23 PLAT15505.2:123-2909(-)